MIPSFTRQKWLLLLGDVARILVATYLSPLIRLGHGSNVFYHHTGATTFTPFLHLVMMYIFDLYNLNRDFTSRDSARRAVLAVVITGFLAILPILYLLLNGKYGWGIFLTQMTMVWFLVLGLCSIFSLLLPVSVQRRDFLTQNSPKHFWVKSHFNDLPISAQSTFG